MGLTDTAIKRSRPAEKPYKLADGKGLYLLVNSSGSKLWRWKYRHERKEKLMPFGAYPDVSLADARIRHAHLDLWRLPRRKYWPSADSGGKIEIQVRDLDQTAVRNPAHDLVRLALSLADGRERVGPARCHRCQDDGADDRRMILLRP